MASDSGLRPTPSFHEVQELIEKRLFVAKVPPGTEEGELREAFGEFGELTECKVVQGRGCGFVGFRTWGEAHRALLKTDMKLSLSRHNNGQVVSVSFADRTQGRGRHAGAYLAKGLDNCRVFVDRLPKDVSVSDVYDLFRPIGRVQTANLLPSKGHRRGGFVTFGCWGEALDAVELMGGHMYPNKDGEELYVALDDEAGQSNGAVSLQAAAGAPAERRSSCSSSYGGAGRRRSRTLSRSGRDEGDNLARTLETLKDEYLAALEGGRRDIECTALHWELLRVRAALGDGLGERATGRRRGGACGGGEGSACKGRVGKASEGDGKGGGVRPVRGDDEEDSPDAARLFIGGLPKECSSEELGALLDQVVKSFRTKDFEILECRALVGKGCGYIRFSSWDAATECLEALDDRAVAGWPHPLRAKWAVKKSTDEPWHAGAAASPPGRGAWGAPAPKERRPTQSIFAGTRLAQAVGRPWRRSGRSRSRSRTPPPAGGLRRGSGAPPWAEEEAGAGAEASRIFVGQMRSNVTAEQLRDTFDQVWPTSPTRATDMHSGLWRR